MLVVGAGQSSAWTNYCTNDPTFPVGEDLGVDVGPGIVFVRTDLQLAELTSGNPDPTICVNNEQYSVTVTTTGGPYVWVTNCSNGTCTHGNVLDDTGLKPSGPTTINILPVTTVDPGYDLYVDGTNLTP